MDRFIVNRMWPVVSLLGMVLGLYLMYSALLSSNVAFISAQSVIEALFIFSFFASIRYRSNVKYPSR